MEQKKFDPNSIIGFVLIFGILLWIMYQNQPDPAVIAAEKAQKRWWFRKLKKELNDKVVTEATVAVATTGDVQLAQLEKKLGSLLIPLHCRQLRIVLLLLKIN
jgi:YidC/Oxa1 family membrane protein insertase